LPKTVSRRLSERQIDGQRALRLRGHADGGGHLPDLGRRRVQGGRRRRPVARTVAAKHRGDQGTAAARRLERGDLPGQPARPGGGLDGQGRRDGHEAGRRHALREDLRRIPDRSDHVEGGPPPRSADRRPIALRGGEGADRFLDRRHADAQKRHRLRQAWPPRAWPVCSPCLAGWPAS